MLSARQRVLSSTLGRAHGASSTAVRRLVVNLALLAQAQYESPPASEAGVSPDPACLADSERPRGLDPSGEAVAAPLPSPLPSPLSAPLRRRTPEEVAAFREVTSRLLQQRLIEPDTSTHGGRAMPTAVRRAGMMRYYSKSIPGLLPPPPPSPPRSPPDSDDEVTDGSAATSWPRHGAGSPPSDSPPSHHHSWWAGDGPCVVCACEWNYFCVTCGATFCGGCQGKVMHRPRYGPARPGPVCAMLSRGPAAPSESPPPSRPPSPPAADTAESDQDSAVDAKPSNGVWMANWAVVAIDVNTGIVAVSLLSCTGGLKSIDFTHTHGYTIQPIEPSVTYDRMQTAIGNFAIDEVTGCSVAVQQAILGCPPSPLAIAIHAVDSPPPSFPVPTEMQAAAIAGALTNPVHLIVGPPGTGKKRLLFMLSGHSSVNAVGLSWSAHRPMPRLTTSLADCIPSS